jgi:hypothetical protein
MVHRQGFSIQNLQKNNPSGVFLLKIAFMAEGFHDRKSGSLWLLSARCYSTLILDESGFRFQ